MDKSRHLRLKTRIEKKVYDNTLCINNHNGIDAQEPPIYQVIEGPKLYTVKVQVRVLCFWLTVWAETCDLSDGDTRSYINI